MPSEAFFVSTGSHGESLYIAANPIKAGRQANLWLCSKGVVDESLPRMKTLRPLGSAPALVSNEVK